jgi:hypothetical protein
VRIIDVPRFDALFSFGFPSHRPGDATAHARLSPPKSQKSEKQTPGTEHRLSDGLLVHDPGRRCPKNMQRTSARPTKAAAGRCHTVLPTGHIVTEGKPRRQAD